jgi:hypothetical protein
MLFSFEPRTFIDATITPFEPALTIAHVIAKEAIISLPVFPHDETSSMHLVGLPFTLVGLAIGPDVLSEALYLILDEIPGVYASICKIQGTMTVLLAFSVHAFVLGAIRPLFYS